MDVSEFREEINSVLNDSIPHLKQKFSFEDSKIIDSLLEHIDAEFEREDCEFPKTSSLYSGYCLFSKHQKAYKLADSQFTFVEEIIKSLLNHSLDKVKDESGDSSFNDEDFLRKNGNAPFSGLQTLKHGLKLFQEYVRYLREITEDITEVKYVIADSGGALHTYLTSPTCNEYNIILKFQKGVEKLNEIDARHPEGSLLEKVRSFYPSQTAYDIDASYKEYIQNQEASLGIN